ncbi:hypothetical protein HPB47_026768 [Ixodes persulcatus]|uniref:Uncharacterized protein n=1 Tax=Ixodes persulcatus TaxID=34615 RepID=A0AC60PYA2_IXOPE|nr:hypothetical protein HPB47_026768 [Ixodes persulcatus]
MLSMMASTGVSAGTFNEKHCAFVGVDMAEASSPGDEQISRGPRTRVKRETLHRDERPQPGTMAIRVSQVDEPRLFTEIRTHPGWDALPESQWPSRKSRISIAEDEDGVRRALAFVNGYELRGFFGCLVPAQLRADSTGRPGPSNGQRCTHVPALAEVRNPNMDSDVSLMGALSPGKVTARLPRISWIEVITAFVQFYCIMCHCIFLMFIALWMFVKEVSKRSAVRWNACISAVVGEKYACGTNTSTSSSTMSLDEMDDSRGTCESKVFGEWRLQRPEPRRCLESGVSAGDACTLGARCLVSSVTTDPSHIGDTTDPE